MAGPAEEEVFPGQGRLHGAHAHRQLPPGKDGVQTDEQVVVQGDVLPEGGRFGGELGQDAVDLLLLLGLEFPEFVVGLHHPHGLNEEGGTGAGQVVDQAGDLVFKLRLHRHHVPAGALGDDVLLEVLGLGGGEDALQNVPHLALCGPHVPADGGQFRAGGVGQLPVPHNGAGDLILQEAVGFQGPEEDVDGGLLLLLTLPVVLGRPGGGQDGGDVQQLPGVEAAPHVRPLEGAGHRLHPGKGGAAPEDHPVHGGGGLLQPLGHLLQVGLRPQAAGPLLPLLGHRLVGQQVQDPGKF